MTSRVSAGVRLPLAIVGCGRIANAHVQSILACPDAELTALVDPVEGRASALAERYGLSVGVHRNLREVLDRVAGAIIATPNHLHTEHALQCIEAGVAALIEKPLAVSPSEGLRICEAAERHGVPIAVGYVSRFRGNIVLMRDLLRRRTFGRVRRFVYQAGSRGGWAPLSAYNLDLRTAGGGVLVVTGTHFLDRMLDWFGYPVKASLLDDSRGGPEANAVAAFTFEDRAGPIVGTVRFSKSVYLEAGLVLETDAGAVILRDHPHAPVVVRAADTPQLETIIRARPERPLEPPLDEWGQQLRNFLAAARDRGTPMVSARDGLASLQLLDELYRNRQPLSNDWYREAVPAGVFS